MAYNRFPQTKCAGVAFEGYAQIAEQIGKVIEEKKAAVVAIECYPGVRYDEVLNGLIKPLNPKTIIFSDDLALDIDVINKKIERNLTDDRVFGVLSCHKLCEFFDEEKLEAARAKIDGLTIIYGVGASLVKEPDVLIYADLARWEIQLRYRSKELGNWRMNNFDEDILRKYKRGFFVEWRVADRHKKTLYDKFDYYLDTNEQNNPKLIDGGSFSKAMETIASAPFRLKPYFDPGVWGGQFMKEKFEIDKAKDNLAWSFDGVPEENSLLLNFGGVVVETPAINAVFTNPTKLLGAKVRARFGTEFPIRFDFLDTMGGQNLSLQVHPLTEYIQENFGMHYTQDESYYILEAKDGANVYLGVKTDVDKAAMMADLYSAQDGKMSFPDEKYVNKIPAKKHDHFLIPAGTVHCSGTDTMVLEISATPYIFTFKLWDWDRVGLDGLPRPVHVAHGEKNIQWSRDTKWVLDNLVDRVYTVTEEDGVKEEHTGLHEFEFIETRRHWFSKKVHHKTHESVNMLNLVEGEQAIVESVNGEFEPFIVSYAETFIIPESVKEYTIAPYGASVGKTIATIKAFVRL